MFTDYNYLHESSILKFKNIWLPKFANHWWRFGQTYALVSNNEEDTIVKQLSTKLEHANRTLNWLIKVGDLL